MANSLDFRVKNGLVVATTATIQSSTNATSTLTGALVVTGGAGIGKNLYVGGAIYAATTSYVNNSRILVASDLETVTTKANYITNNPALVSVAGTSTTYGTYNTGTIASIMTASDYLSAGGYYSISDTATTPGFIAYIGFTGVTGFSRLVVILNYTVGSTHTIDIDLYNYVTAGWDTFSVYSGTTNYYQFILQVDDDTKYTSGGIVTARVYHASFGNTAHETRIDYVALEDSVQGGQGPRGPVGATGATGAQGLTTSTTSTFNFFSTETSVSTITGAVRVVGGVGIGGALYVGGNINVLGTINATVIGVITSATNVAGGVAGAIPIQSAPGITTFINTGSVGQVLQMQTGNTSSFVSTSSLQVGYSNTATTVNTLLQTANARYYPTFVDANNTTTTGELLYTTSSFYISPLTGLITATNIALTSLTVNRVPFVTTGGQLIDNANFYVDNPNALFYAGGGGAYIGGTGGFGTVSATNGLINAGSALGGAKLTVGSGGTYLNGNLYVTGISTVTNTTNATSTTTGALQIVGGTGIGGNLYVGGTATIFSTLASTGSIQNNALYVAGGVGIGASLLVTGPAVFQNNVTFSGTSTYVYSTNTVYTDNLINIHVPVGSTGSNHSWSVDDGKDIGFIYHYYKGIDKDAFLGFANDSSYLEWYSNGTEVGGIFTGTEYGTFKTGGIVLTNSTATYSTNTGALTVAGGVGIGGSLYVGGTITATNFVGSFSGTISGTASTASQVNTIFQASDTSYYPTFVDTNNTTTTGELVYTTSSFSINARTGQLTVPSLIVTTNTNGLNIRLGDDVWIGDVDQANTFRVTGQQAGTSGYIIFGNSNTLSLGRAGTGPLTYGGDFTVNGTTAASSTATGALQVKGGAGIGGDLYAANIYTNGTRTIPLSIQEFTATAGQTTFTVAGGYTVGTVQVFANGVNLGSGDITASNGTTVVLTEARRVGDIIRIISGGSSTAVNNIQSFSIAMSVAMAM